MTSHMPSDPVMDYAIQIGASPLALLMLSDPDRPPRLRVIDRPGSRHTVGDAVVHIKPDCRCPRRKN